MKPTSKLRVIFLHQIDFLWNFRMLDMGFADAIKKILQTINKHRGEDQRFQRVLLSATPTTGLLKRNFISYHPRFSIALTDFVDINLNKNALRIDLSEEFNEQSVITVPKTLQQMFIIVPSKLRFVTLIAFLCQIFNTKVKPTEMTIIR